MNHLKDGGPAFPTTRMENINEGSGPPAYVEGSFPGMSLRDYFAAKAMQALLTGMLGLPGAEAVAKAATSANVSEESFVASVAYGFAEAMLIERAK